MPLDSLSGVSGPMQFSAPRGVQVRPPDNLNKMQNAVYGSIAVYTETLTESKAVIDAWPEIMAAASAAASEVLAGVAEAIAQEAQKAAQAARENGSRASSESGGKRVEKWLDV